MIVLQAPRYRAIRRAGTAGLLNRAKYRKKNFPKGERRELAQYAREYRKAHKTRGGGGPL